MPEADGPEVCKFIYEKYPEIQVIILSAYNEFEYARTAIRYDAADYVLKLSVLEELPPAVAKVRKETWRNRKKKLEHELQAEPQKKETESLYEKMLSYIRRKLQQQNCFE